MRRWKVEGVGDSLFSTDFSTNCPFVFDKNAAFAQMHYDYEEFPCVIEGLFSGKIFRLVPSPESPLFAASFILFSPNFSVKCPNCRLKSEPCGCALTIQKSVKLTSYDLSLSCSLPYSLSFFPSLSRSHSLSLSLVFSFTIIKPPIFRNGFTKQAHMTGLPQSELSRGTHVNLITLEEYVCFTRYTYTPHLPLSDAVWNIAYLLLSIIMCFFQDWRWCSHKRTNRRYRGKDAKCCETRGNSLEQRARECGCPWPSILSGETLAMEFQHNFKERRAWR